MNSAPTEVLVATEYITITMDGGIRMPSAPEGDDTRTKVWGIPAYHRRQQDRAGIATTVAGDEPDTRANSAQANTPARPRPAVPCPTIEVAKLIIRLADPPWVRKLPARMKNDRHDLEPLDAR